MPLPAFAQKLLRKHRELIAYLVVGGLTTCVSYGSFALFYNLLSWNKNAANALSIILAVLFAYVTNKHFVFRSRSPDRAALLREALHFFTARAVAMLFELGGLMLLCDVLHMNPNIGKLVVTIAVVLLNYVLSKLFVFKKSKAGGAI